MGSRHSRLRATHHLEAPNIQPPNRIAENPPHSTPPPLIDDPSEWEATHHLDASNIQLPNRIAEHSSHSAPSILTDDPSGSDAAHHFDASNALRARPASSSHELGRVTINILPDDVLLHIFDFDRVNDYSPYLRWPWHRLVHVCQRWRSVVFASPHFLGLSISCSPGTSVELLSIWPPLPIIIQNRINRPLPDIDAVLMQLDRVCEIHLIFRRSSLLQQLAIVMKGQHPTLRLLRLGLCDYDEAPVPVLPDTFLGGSALRLQTLELYSIPFPALPKLVLSATDLVHLSIRGIPYTGYISPGAMGTCLVALTNLESLAIGFQSPSSFPDRRIRRSHLRARTLLPALKVLHFDGISEYLEDLVARIDAPLLDTFHTLLFNQLVFDMPQFSLFVGRATKLKSLNQAEVYFVDYSVFITLQGTVGTGSLELEISSKQSDWQLSSLEQICGQTSPASPLTGLIRSVKRLEICEDRSKWQDDIDKTQWLEFFRPFIAVETLCLSKGLGPLVLPALSEGAMNVLPALRDLSLEEFQSNQEFVTPFFAARQVSGNPVVLQAWEKRNSVMTFGHCKLSRTITDSCP